MKILLINPGTMHGEGESYGALTNPIMGLAYLATYLNNHGFEVEVMEMSTYRQGFKDVEARLKALKPALVGISSKTFNILAGYKIANLVKSISAKILVVFGGPHPTALVEQTMSECADIDAIVRGEGEETLLAIANRLRTGYQFPEDVFADIPGVTYVDRGHNLIHNSERAPISDLDSLPFPDFSLYDFKKFGKVYDTFSGRFESEISIFASRGCPFNCSFCMPLLGRKWRSRSPENVVAEVEHHWRNFGLRRIVFNDSTFGVNRQWFQELCRLLKNSGLHKKIHWAFETRADLASLEMFEEAVDAGAFAVFFGFESGSDQILAKNGKEITRADILKAVTLARQAKVPTVSGSFIIGLPYETKETLRETKDLIAELALDFVGVNIVSIYPGTKLWDMVERGEGGVRWLPASRMNWGNYDRTTCQIEVNELSASDILTALEQAKIVGMQIMKQKSFISYLHKSNAYFWYLLLNDRKKLHYYLKWGVKELFHRKRVI